MLTNAFRPGAPNWLDLASPDTPASAAFYTGLFGWTSATGPGAARHSLFRQDGRTVAALGPVASPATAPPGPCTSAPSTPTAPRAWSARPHGRVRFGPFDILASGRTTGCTDPTGADFAVWQPHDVRGLDTVTEPGSLCWTECFSIDTEAAKTFYRAVFGWQEQDVPLGLDLYTVLTPPGGGTADAHGGICPIPPEDAAAGISSHWLPSFEVPDVDATLAAAERLGATVRLPAEDVHGVGRLARLVDPHGAAFAVVTSAPPG